LPSNHLDGQSFVAGFFEHEVDGVVERRRGWMRDAGCEMDVKVDPAD